MLKSSLLYKIINGIWDMCYIWKTEMRNVFRDEGVLIFCVLVPLGYPLLYSWIYNNEVVREVDTAIVDLSQHLQWVPDERCNTPLERPRSLLCPAYPYHLEHQEGNAGLQVLAVGE